MKLIAPCADSPHSVLTVDSSMEFYQDDHGRLVNTQCDIYRLPADQEELERLDKQHDVLARLMGFKYISEMGIVLANTPETFLILRLLVLI